MGRTMTTHDKGTTDAANTVETLNSSAVPPPPERTTAPAPAPSAAQSTQDFLWQVNHLTSDHARARAQVRLFNQQAGSGTDVLSSEQQARVAQVSAFIPDDATQPSAQDSTQPSAPDRTQPNPAPISPQAAPSAPDATSPQLAPPELNPNSPYVQSLTAQAAQVSAEQRARTNMVDAPWANVYSHPSPEPSPLSTLRPAPPAPSAALSIPGSAAPTPSSNLSPEPLAYSWPSGSVSPKLNPDFAYHPELNTDLESPDTVSYYDLSPPPPPLPHNPVEPPQAHQDRPSTLYSSAQSANSTLITDFAQHCSEDLMAALHYLQLNQALQQIFYPQGFKSPVPWDHYRDQTTNPASQAPTSDRDANDQVQHEARAVIEGAGMGSFASMVGAAGFMTTHQQVVPATASQAAPTASANSPGATTADATTAGAALPGEAMPADAAQTAAALSNVALGLKPQAESASASASSEPAVNLAGLSTLTHALGLEGNEALSRSDLARGIANLEHSMAVLLNMLGCGVMIHAVGPNHQRKVIWANDAMYQIYGYSAQEFDRISSDATLPQIVHPADINVFFANFERVHDTNTTIHFEYRILNGCSKHYVWCEMRSAYMGQLGTMSLFICLVRDITEEKHQKDRTERWIRKSALLSEACQELVFEYDYNTDTFERFGNYLNFVPTDKRVQHHFLQNLPSKENMHPDDKHYFSSLLRDTSLATSNKRRTVKFRLRPLNGSEFLWHSCSAIGYTEESTGHIKIIGKVSNIHQVETKLATLHQENQRDPMTKLYNKRAMEQLVRQVLKDKPLQRHALLMIDIDSFKQVNDSRGHAFGDEVILMIAHCLSHTFRRSDLVARVGGDEFAVLLQNVTFDQAVALGEIYHRIVAEQSQKLSQPYPVTSSVGIAFCPDDASGYDDLYHAADQALYWVKRNCKGAMALYSNAQEALQHPGLTPDCAGLPPRLRPHTAPSLTPPDAAESSLTPPYAAESSLTPPDAAKSSLTPPDTAESSLTPPPDAESRLTPPSDAAPICPALKSQASHELPPLNYNAIAAALGLAGVKETHFKHEQERFEHSLRAIACDIASDIAAASDDQPPED